MSERRRREPVDRSGRTAESRMRDWEIAQPTLIYRAPPGDLVRELVKQAVAPSEVPPPPSGSLTKLASLIKAADELKDR